MAISAGRRASPTGVMLLAIAFGIAAAAAGAAALAALSPESGTNALPFAGLSVAAAGIAFLIRAERRRHAHEAKLAADLAILSGRLLRLEANESPPLPVDVVRLAETTAGIAADVDILSRLVQDLAEALDAQGRHSATHAAAPAARPGPHSAAPAADPQPAPAPHSAAAARAAPSAATLAVELTTREDFARAASAILRRLAPDAPAPAPTAGDEAILAALGDGRVELHLQPVVTLPQRRTRYYDASTRLRIDAATLLAPADFRAVLARHGRLAELEAAALDRTLAIARHLAGRDHGASVSCSLSLQSLSDRAFLVECERRLEFDRSAARRMVIEIAEAELALMGPAEQAALARFSALGAALALDSARDLHADWVGLVRRGFDYAKIDAAAILEARPPGETTALVGEVAAAGMQLIATHVGREEFVPDLLDYDVPLAQGSAIAAPRPVRAEIVAKTEPAAEPAAPVAPPAASEAAAPGQRTSFRDYLRGAN